MTTNKLNISSVLIGGAAAGLTTFAINGVINGVVLQKDFVDWSAQMGGLLHPPMLPIALALWALMCLTYGTVGVALYAGLRSRFGPGPKTALLTGLALYAVGKLTTGMDLLTLGVLPTRLIAGQLLCGLLAIPAGVFVGAWLYRE